MKKAGKKVMAAILSACMASVIALPAAAEEAAVGADAAAEEGSESSEDLSEEAVTDEGIREVSAEAFVDADGAKISAVLVKYAGELDPESVSAEDFDVKPYDVIASSACQLGEENVGQVTDVAVDGNTVKISFNTDYQRESVPKYYSAVSVSVEQVGEVTAKDGTVIEAADTVYTNYTESEKTFPDGRVSTQYTAEDGTYSFTDIDGYQLFTLEDGTAFHAEDCFEEETGETIDVDLPYALYVPEDYSDDGNYGLVLQIHDAGTMGDDPMLTLTESQACANFASEEVQQMAKDAGLDGLIVVAPMLNNSLRSARDNYTTSAAVPATWQLLDYITDTYTGINMDRIFGTGQSMGGMQVIAMAAQRDNYFAGIWEHGCQWGANWNKASEYTSKGESASYFTSDDATIWRTDDDGNDSELGQNFYYLLSDDNLLISNCQGDAYSTIVWREIAYLLDDIAGVEIPYTSFDPLTDSLESQNAAVEELTATENDGFGWYWYSYSGGTHMLTWVYGHKLDAGYEWLVNQTRETEHERSKITELANDWAAETDEATLAEKNTEDRLIQETDGVEYYFAVPAEGAGTRGYNAGWFSSSDGTLNDTAHYPGWENQIIYCGTMLTDEEYAHYFENTAEEDLAKLIQEGKITVNGTVINGEVEVNGALGIWQNEDGTWGYNAHGFMAHGDNVTYEEAALGFVVGISKLHGPQYTLTTVNGKAAAIDFEVHDVAFAETVTIGEEYTTLTISDLDGQYGDGSMNRANPAEIQFPNANVEGDSEGTLPSDQCGIAYWEDEDGWHLTRLDAEVVTATKDTEINGTEINAEYAQAWNRPSQPIAAIGYMDAESWDLIWWKCDIGDTEKMSITSMADPYKFLGEGIETAKAGIEELVISEDGSDVDPDQKWVTQEDYDAFMTAYDRAADTYAQEGLYDSDYYEALYRLALAYGGDGGFHAKEGNAFSDGIGIMNRAQAGTRS